MVSGHALVRPVNAGPYPAGWSGCFFFQSSCRARMRLKGPVEGKRRLIEVVERHGRAEVAADVLGSRWR